ncbi:AAA family ATPase [Virgibacillus litoralis]|uniref:Pilus assembly protein CpaE n=1 Tax=Virgibacillus litoralis TaxID=578221 RepID=A0ABS4HEE5_9BACI|nr:AAA family ATPase [Virgibacillus litoralis]MBP1949282.1 pilus assembly protein CpaE [Virgibacillus litoralis]
MVKIYSIAGNDDLTTGLSRLINDSENKLYWAANETKLFEQLQSEDKSVVILPDTNAYDVYRLCEKVSLQFPLATPLLIFQSEEELDMKKALRAGAADVIFLSSSFSKIREDIQLAISNSESKSYFQLKSKPVKNAKVITVASTKGGVGKTTVAVNLAASYGKKIAKVAVIDLDLQFGDVAMYMDLKPKRTIYDWVKEDQDGTKIENFMTEYKNGISVMAAPPRPEFAEVITGDYVRKAIYSLKKLYDVVIIDTACSMDENVIVALENSDDILVMTFLDLPTLKNSKMLLDTLGSLHIGDRAKVVLNRQMKVKGITVDTVEKVLGRKVYTTLPAMDKPMITAINEGNPLNYTNPRSQVAKRLFRLAEALYNPESRSSKKKKKAKRVEVSAGGHV